MVTIAHGQSLNDGVGLLTMSKMKRAMVLQVGTFAINDAGGGITALGPDGDGLAVEINIPVAITREYAIGEFDYIARTTGIDGFLDSDGPIGCDRNYLGGSG